MNKSLEIVQQESEEAKKYLLSLEREKCKRPVNEELKKLKKLIDTLQTLARAKQTISKGIIKYQRV
ncbi:MULTISPECIES: hypothetical protein [unclassified Enterococcus]|uniref:hypothetical protein n=1 Tax=unclassified Enterococcus TaxID=2608891 RepID=UPI000A3585AC|nr:MULTISPECIES: hypothetical protein [unclassified Enterococcus]